MATMNIQDARQIAHDGIMKVVEHRGMSEGRAQEYLDRVPKTPVVELAFDISVRALWFGLETLVSKAAENIEALKQLKNWPVIEAAKGKWLESSVADAKKFLAETAHRSDLPDVGEVFVPQRLTKEMRFGIQNMILDMEMIAFYGLCSNGCGNRADWNQERNGFHFVCGSCHQARIKAEKAAAAAAPARSWVNTGESYETVEVTSVKTTTAVVEKREASKKAEELRKGLLEAQEAKKNKKSGRTSRESDESRSGSYRVR